MKTRPPTFNFTHWLERVGTGECVVRASGQTGDTEGTVGDITVMGDGGAIGDNALSGGTTGAIDDTRSSLVFIQAVHLRTANFIHFNWDLV